MTVYLWVFWLIVLAVLIVLAESARLNAVAREISEGLDERCK